MAKQKASSSAATAVDDVASCAPEWTDILRQMIFIRRFEEATEREFRRGKIGGYLHVYIGQEAVASGILGALRKDDIVFATLGAAWCFLINGISFGAVIIALLLIHMPPIQDQSAKRSVLADMREGFVFVRQRRALLMLTFLSFAGTFLGMPLFTMLPVVAKRIFDLGPRGLSLLQADYGVGSVIGALLVASSSYAAKKGKLALMLQLAFACTLVAFGLSRNLGLSLVIAFVAGICIVGVISLYSSLVQLTTNDAMRGRVMSIFMLAFRGGMPLGNLMAGFVAQRWSISTALEVNGIALAVVALAFIIRGTDLDAGLT